MKSTTRFSILLILTAWCAGALAQSYRQANDISYTSKTDAYSLERLKLDIYYPEGVSDRPVVVWFHGGGLEGGHIRAAGSFGGGVYGFPEGTA